MRSDKPRTVALLLAFVVSLPMAPGAVATPGVAAGEHATAPVPLAPAFLPTTAAQDPSAIEASLRLNRSTRRLIQQALRNQGFDPGEPDGLFGPRTRAAIRRWQEARGVPPTGYLASTEAELLSAAAALPTSRSDTAATTPALDSTSSAPLDLTARAGDGSTVAQLAAPTNPNSAVLETLPTAEDSPRPEPQTDRTPAARATAPAQLPPDIMLDSYLLRAEESVRADDRAGALAAMEQIDALQAEHELRLGCEAPASFLWLTRAFRNSGAKWDRSPELVNDHDFRSDAEGLAVPYGIYDPRANAGTVFVGRTADTPAFAVDCIEKWWRIEGRKHYPEADALQILADGGGRFDRGRFQEYADFIAAQTQQFQAVVTAPMEDALPDVSLLEGLHVARLRGHEANVRIE